MKCKSIRVAKLFNTGNYEHERIEVELELNDNETATEALARAREFIAYHDPKKVRELEDAKTILLAVEKSPDRYSYSTVTKAKELIGAHEDTSTRFDI